jgi:hypothetical protein
MTDWVVVIQSCFSGDLYLEALCVRLRCIGNTPVRSTFGAERGMPATRRNQVQAQIAN